MKILLFGASGSGTTTLGRAVEKRTRLKHLDVDDYYWKKTSPPYQEKIRLEVRKEHLKADFSRYKNAVVSGSLVSWGEEWQSAFDLAVFLKLEKTERMNRLKNREFQRYGKKLYTDPIIQQTSNDFLVWAAQYDYPDFKGRSLKLHKEWLSLLDCTVLTLNTARNIQENVEIILQHIPLDDKNLQQDA